MAAEDAELKKRKIGLDAPEEDLAAREEVLAAKPRGKDEEVEKLVMQRTLELEQKHKEVLEAQATEHAGKFKEAVNAAKAAKAVKNELAIKVKELKADLDASSKEISAFKADKEI